MAEERPADQAGGLPTNLSSGGCTKEAEDGCSCFTFPATVVQAPADAWNLDLKSKAEKRDPKHGAMSEMDRCSLDMGGRLTERAGGRGSHANVCHRYSRSSVHSQAWKGEMDNVGGPPEHVREEVAGCRSTVCARSPEDAQPPMHESLQSNRISRVREEEGLPGGSE